MQKTYLSGAIAAILVILGAVWFTGMGGGEDTAPAAEEVTEVTQAPAPAPAPATEEVATAAPVAEPEPAAIPTPEPTAPAEDPAPTPAEQSQPVAEPVVTPPQADPAPVTETTEAAPAEALPTEEVAQETSPVAEPEAEVVAEAAPAADASVATEAPAADPVAALPVLDATPAEPTADAAADEATTTPSFEIVRVETDGATIVAGRAAPGAEVNVTLDGQTAATATADARGDFVALMDTPATGQNQEMRLSSVDENAQEVTSTETIIVLVEEPEETPAAAADTTDAPTDAPAADTPTETDTRPVIVRATDDGVEVVQSAETLPEEQVTIDTISYSITGDVVLTGRGAGEQQLVIYADGDAVGRGRVRPDGRWRVILGDVEEGLYLLRIDQINDIGDVTSRAETPFQRVFPEVPVAEAAPAETSEEGAASMSLADAAAMLATQTEAAAAATVEDVATAPAEATGTAPAAPDSNTAPAPTPAVAAAVVADVPATRPTQIVVQPGNNLWTIARVEYGEGIRYTQIFEANSDQIRDPDLIFPGQIFAIPREQ
ncbi:nucleoid-associated protein YgaU [Rubricella aquisinus]|uniref:Nucleoid-associated protein YgaU n=1 Tax=Rubricella aquisinus TaxID=2028108 RepID=A0A840X3W2_9RHOB|nr:LysM peptidoglycan-binding domain-containing protein [Rubricella aquisinus]MBB5516496.1 nucleoid-associated protein YgaU [Rubricella aquisinus]